MNLYSAKTIEEYSKALHIKLKLINNKQKSKKMKIENSKPIKSFLKKKCFKLLLKNGEAATCSYS